MPASRPLKERFWEKVVKADWGCWMWTGSRAKGYGTIAVGRKMWLAHRLSYGWYWHAAAFMDWLHERGFHEFTLWANGHKERYR